MAEILPRRCKNVNKSIDHFILLFMTFVVDPLGSAAKILPLG
jgi:hypothetical protein